MKILQLSTNLFIAAVISITIDCLLKLTSNSETVGTATNQAIVIGLSPQEQREKSSQSEKLDFSGDGRPGKRAGGGSRNTCPSTNMNLTALVPANNVGTTVSDRPNFWFYVPHTPQQATAGEFVLQDRQENDVYRQTFTLPDTPGLVSLQLPQTAPALAVDQSYHWYFKLYCGDFSSAANFVEGWVVRIPLPPDLSTRLKQEKDLAYSEYGNRSIWFNSLDSLAQLRLKNDNPQLKSDWNKLLSAEGVDLDKLTQKPLVGTVKNTARDNQ